jgi:hypothetical protein
MGSFNVNVSPRHGAINIELALWDITQREDLLPISGFPRNLVLEGHGEGEPTFISMIVKILLTVSKRSYKSQTTVDSTTCSSPESYKAERSTTGR